MKCKYKTVIISRGQQYTKRGGKSNLEKILAFFLLRVCRGLRVYSYIYCFRMEKRFKNTEFPEYFSKQNIPFWIKMRSPILTLK